MESPHQHLVNSLLTFYTLLADLCYIQPSDFIQPPYIINEEAAREDGFTDNAIAVMHLIPYLSENVHRHKVSMETFPRSYIDTDDFEDSRNPAYADDALPPHALTLTYTNVYGLALIYDTKTCQPTSLNVADGTVDLEGHQCFSRLTFQPPEDLLGQWIKAFSTLEWIPYHNSWGQPTDLFQS